MKINKTLQSMNYIEAKENKGNKYCKHCFYCGKYYNSKAIEVYYCYFKGVRTVNIEPDGVCENYMEQT